MSNFVFQPVSLPHVLQRWGSTTPRQKLFWTQELLRFGGFLRTPWCMQELRILVSTFWSRWTYLQGMWFTNNNFPLASNWCTHGDDEWNVSYGSFKCFLLISTYSFFIFFFRVYFILWESLLHPWVPLCLIQRYVCPHWLSTIIFYWYRRMWWVHLGLCTPSWDHGWPTLLKIGNRFAVSHDFCVLLILYNY